MKSLKPHNEPGIFVNTPRLPRFLGNTRKVLAAAVALGLGIGGVIAVAAPAQAALVSVEYVSSASGTVSTVNANTVDATFTSGAKSGWFYCNTNLTLNSRVLVASGATLNLILGDNCNLSIQSSSADSAGIEVPKGSSLAIYGQSGNTGKLNVQATADHNAGIGGGYSTREAPGRISIFGGNVTATGARDGAGIGASGNFVTAEMGAISLSWNANVTANGGNGSGGVLSCSQGAPGIGAANSTSNTPLDLTINTTGLVRAKSGDAGWPCSSRPDIAKGTLRSIATITASASVTGNGTVTPNAKVDHVAVGSAITYTAAPGAGQSVAAAQGNNVDMTSLGSGKYLFPVTASNSAQTAAFVFAPMVPANYVSDASGTVSTVNATTVDSNFTNGAKFGWFYCNSKLTLNDSVLVADSKELNLILGDSCDLTIVSSYHRHAGIEVPKSSRLSIYAQARNTGKLSATATTSDNAGIGGGALHNEAPGQVSIFGGNVTARGSKNGAGIGSTGPISTDGMGAISIHWNANVTAYGGEPRNLAVLPPQCWGGGAGIGTGGTMSAIVSSDDPMWQPAPPITINTTGTVRAFGGPSISTCKKAADIGVGGNDQAEISSIPTVNLSAPMVARRGSVTPNTVVDHVAVGSAVTYTASPTLGGNVTSATGNGRDLISLEKNAYRFPITAATNDQAVAFEFSQSTLLAIDENPLGGQTRPGNVVLSASLSAGGKGLAGKSVSFWQQSGDEPYSLLGSATTDASGAATYTVDAPSTGTYAYYVSFAGDSSYDSSQSAVVPGYRVVSAEQDALTLNGIGTTYKYGDAPISLSTSGGSGDGQVSLTSSDETVASLSDTTPAGDGVLTLNHAGTFTITQSKAADATYSKATNTSQVVTVAEATPVSVITRSGGLSARFTMTVDKREAGGTPRGMVQFYLNGVPVGDPVPLTTDSEGNGVATLNEGLLHLSSDTSPARNDAFNASGASFSTPGASFTLVSALLNVADEPLESGDEQTVRAEFLGDDGKYVGVSSEVSWIPGAADQDPALTVSAPSQVQFGDAPFTLTTDGGAGTGAVSYEVLSGDDVLTVDPSSGQVTIQGAGKATVRARKASSDGWNEAQSSPFVVTVTPVDLGDVAAEVTGGPFTFADAQLTPEVAATFTGSAGETYDLVAGSDYTVTYGENVHAGTDAGAITLTATGRNYVGTTTAHFSIEKAQPPLSLNGLANNVVASELPRPAALSVQAVFGNQQDGFHSGKEVTFTQTQGPSIDLGGAVETDAGGNAVSAITSAPKLGVYGFRAEFAGDADYLPATAELQDFAVVLGHQDPTITGIEANGTYGSGPFTLSLAGNEGTGAVTFTSSDPSIARVDGATLTVERAGTFQLTGHVAADSVYDAADTPAFDVIVSETAPLVALGAEGGESTDTPLVLTATVVSPAEASAALTGEVEFYEDSALVGTGTLHEGVASVTISQPARGEHRYHALFTGTPTYFAAAQSPERVRSVAGIPQPDFAIVAPATIDTVYGNAAFELETVGALGTGAVTWSVPALNPVAQIDPVTGRVIMLNAGNVTVTAQIAGDNVYDEAVATYELRVTPREVTVSAEAATMQIGDPVPQLTPTFSPTLVSGDSLAGSLKLAGPVQVGEVQIVEDEAFTNPNYSVTFAPGVLTIAPSEMQQRVIDAILALPEQITSYAQADAVFDVAALFAQMSDEEDASFPDSVFARLVTATVAAGKVNHVDPESGITAAAAELPWYVRLRVDQVSSEDAAVFAGTLTAGRELLALHDIHFENPKAGGANWQPATGTSVSISLPEVARPGYGDIQVQHRLASGDMETLAATVEGTTVRFDGTSFSPYGVSGVKQHSDDGGNSNGGKLPNTGSESTHALLLLGNAVLLLGLFAFVVQSFRAGRRRTS